MKIAEIYQSRQGEGLLTGTPSVFVRTSGCNLRCWYCDTPYTSWQPEGNELEIEEILAQVESMPPRHVVITGGEPMLFTELAPLCAALMRKGRHVTIETAGTRYLSLNCDLMSISPKLANSTPSAERDAIWHSRHEERRHQPEVVRRLMSEHAYQLKFVVDTPADFADIERYVGQLGMVDPSRVLLMPQGTTVDELEQKRPWITDYCESKGWRFCPRRHIEWYGLVRGT